MPKDVTAFPGCATYAATRSVAQRKETKKRVVDQTVTVLGRRGAPPPRASAKASSPVATSAYACMPNATAVCCQLLSDSAPKVADGPSSDACTARGA